MVSERLWMDGWVGGEFGEKGDAYPPGALRGGSLAKVRAKIAGL